MAVYRTRSAWWRSPRAQMALWAFAYLAAIILICGTIGALL